MIIPTVARTAIPAFILMFFSVGYTVAHNKVVVIPLEADAKVSSAVGGVSGYERITITNNVTIPAGLFSANQDVNCPGVKKVLGGGGFASNSTVEMISSFPSSGDQRWRSRYRNTTSSSINVSINSYAICANTAN